MFDLLNAPHHGWGREPSSRRPNNVFESVAFLLRETPTEVSLVQNYGGIEGGRCGQRVAHTFRTF
jgi:hypothetical protein